MPKQSKKTHNHVFSCHIPGPETLMTIDRCRDCRRTILAPPWNVFCVACERKRGQRGTSLIEGNSQRCGSGRS